LKDNALFTMLLSIHLQFAAFWIFLQI